MSKYIEEPQPDDHILTVKEFFEYCQDGLFMDGDGHGHPMKGGLINPNEWIYPSKRNSITRDVTHIAWYNK